MHIIVYIACIAGYFRLSNALTTPSTPHDNGAILIECKTIRNVVTSAAEAETHGVFHNAKQAIPIRHILNAIGHPQIAPTPIKTDNSTSAGYVNNNMQLKKSKTWDMYLHWLRDKENQKIFKVYWDKGANQGADYFTKHHPIIHHRRIRLSKQYVRDACNLIRDHFNQILRPLNHLS